MFDLEAAIRKWRNRLKWREGLSEADIDEMEGHVRDQVESLTEEAWHEREAFFQTIKEFGEDDELERNFNRANWEKVTARRVGLAPMLIANYIKVAIRSLLAYKLYSAITILGLAVGLAAVTLTSVYIRHEFGFEAIHKNRDRIYRVIRETTRRGEDPNYNRGETSGALAEALRREIPEAEHAAIVSHSIGGVTEVRHGEKPFLMNFASSDLSFFDIFTFPLSSGTASSLADPSAILISESAAERVFGEREPMGEELTIPGGYQAGTYTVTGVVKDIPGTTRFRADLYSGISRSEKIQNDLRSWRVRGWVQTYVLLREGSDPASVEEKLSAFAEQHLQSVDRIRETYHLQPLSRVRLYSRSDYGIDRRLIGNIDHIYIASGITFLIVLSACINFIILSTARSADRAREIGIRKVSGAVRGLLIQQFLGEAVIISGIALVGGILLARALLPVFSDLVYPSYTSFTGNTYGGINLSISLDTLPVLAALAIGIGLLAGIYPALVLSRIQSIAAVQSSAAQPGSRSLRRCLVVIQFALAIAITIGTWTVHRQVQYLSEKDLGYRSEHIIGLLQLYPNKGLRERYESIKHEFLQHSHISEVSASDMTIGGRVHDVYPEGFSGETKRMTHRSIDEAYLDMFDIDLVTGRNFRAGPDGDAYLLNETAVNALGWDNPIGKRFDAFEPGLRPGAVVGVVKDFHFENLREPIKPMFFTKEPLTFLMLWLKVDTVDLEETLAYIDSIQRRLIPEYTPERKFLDDILAEGYRDDERLENVLTIFACVAISVACLGLFGFVCYTAHRRSREIAVRKALGATDLSIIRMLSKDFIGLVLVANAVAWPLAYWLLRRWLDGFAYRQNLSFGAFLGCGVVVLIFATASAAHQGWRAATSSPVDALRRS